MSKQADRGVLFNGACCSPLTQGALTADQAASLAPAFKALGDPVRLRLFSIIAARGGEEVCVCDLSGAFDVTGPTISHHLRTLREAGLVRCERRGTWVYYWLAPGVLPGLAGLLGAAGQAPASAETSGLAASGLAASGLAESLAL